MNGLTKNNGNGSYIGGLKEAKRLISEGRAQLKAAQKLMDHEKYENALNANYHLLADAKIRSERRDEIIIGLSETERMLMNRGKTSEKKAHDSVEKIMRGLNTYCDLLNYENTPHFGRIKTAIKYTLDEFDSVIPAEAYEKYRNALFIGPE